MRSHSSTNLDQSLNHTHTVSSANIWSAWPVLLRLSLRNIWRNKRRTWLTLSGIAFAVFLLVFARSLQDGTFIGMVDNIANMLLGHAQIQHPEEEDDPRLEHLLYDTSRLTGVASQTSGVAHVSARAESFALVSNEDRSFGAQVIGVEPDVERQWNTLAQESAQGRYLAGPGEAYLGATLARNLNVAPGDELVLLGTAYQGGVAAAAVTLVGTFTSASPELNRAVMMIDLTDFRDAWLLDSDAAHRIVIQAASVADGEAAATQLQQTLASQPIAPDANINLRVRDWRSLMPEAVQTMDIKSLSTDLFFYLIAIIVTFSVVNTFLMTMFERSPEFGMMMSLGMRPSGLLVMLLLEALWIGLLGVLIGGGLAWVLVLTTGIHGIPVPEAASQAAQGMNIPTRFVPVFNWEALRFAVVGMLIATQLAALWPGLKLLKLRPVEALRDRNS